LLTSQLAKLGPVGMGLLLLVGCIEQEVSRTPRTAVEQLLLTQAAELALHNLTAALPEHASLLVEVTGLQTDRAHLNMMTDLGRGVLHDPSHDLLLIRDVTATALGRMGYQISPPKTDPAYLARVVVESFGTTQSLSFFGLPPIQSVVIPITLPELALYKLQRQNGYARLHVDFFDNQTGGYVGSTSTIIGRTYYNQYKILFFIGWVRTDMSAPP
jgi:hypothetical protein